MSDYVPILHPLIGVALGAGISYIGFRSLKRKRLVEDTGTSVASAAAVGHIELAGTAHPLDDRPVIGPISGQPCAFFKWSVQRKSGKSWKTVKKGKSGAFLLRDASGAILVDPSGAELHLHEHEVSSGFGRDPPPAIQEFCAREGIKWEGMTGANHPMRFVEGSSPVGGPVYVLGRAEVDERGDALHAQGVTVNTLVIMQGPDAFVISDTEQAARVKLGKSSRFSVILGGVILVGGILMLIRDAGGSG